MKVARSVGMLSVLLLIPAAAIFGAAYWMEYTREEAWRQSFQLRLEAMSDRGLATSFEELKRRIPKVPESENGAAALMGLVAECDAVCGDTSSGPLWMAYKAIEFDEEPSREDRAVAETLLHVEAERIHALWNAVDEAVAQPAVRSSDPGPVTARALHAGRRRAWFLMLLRAWAEPAQELKSARTLLRLAEHTTLQNGSDVFRWDDHLDAALAMVRRVIARHEPLSQEDREVLDRQLAHLEEASLALYAGAPEAYRISWASHADPDDRRWPWVSDYDHFGEGWKLYRDFIRAFDRVEAVAPALRTEAGIRTFATKERDLADWNSKLPPLWRLGAWTLQDLTRLRLARLALALVALRDDPTIAAEDLAARARALLREGPPDALTGKPFLLAEEGTHLFIGVPWRELDFPLRPSFVRRPWDKASGEPQPTWRSDALRTKSYIWAIPR